MDQGNIFAGLPKGSFPEELFEPLVSTGNMRIERIISTGQSTPDGEWLSASGHEWVVLLKGEAALLFEGEPGERVLMPGDWLRIPPGWRHRVTRTASGEPTVWLAVHFGGT